MDNPDFFHIEYEFSSTLGGVYEDRYITTYFGKVFKEDYEGTTKELVGKFELKLMLLQLALNDSCMLEEIFDMEEYTFRIGNDIYDFENLRPKEDIFQFYDEEFVNGDICIITRFEIAAEHRGKGLGKKLVKDIYNRFFSSCGLFVVQAFPLQFEASKLTQEDAEWFAKMNFKGLDDDFEKAFYQLKAFYQKLGFDHIKGYDNYMFLNSNFPNSKINAISFDEPDLD